MIALAIAATLILRAPVMPGAAPGTVAAPQVAPERNHLRWMLGGAW